MTNNIILLSDSYKVSHWKQYPPKTTNVYSYFESRGGRFDHTVFFGLQYILKHYLTTPVTYKAIQEAEELYTQHFGSATLFNGKGWEYIVEKHRGRLPVRIKAVAEGTRVPVSNVLMTIENTDPNVPWLTNFLETLLVQAWYPTTVATLSYETRQLILNYLVETGDPSLIDFKLHDFGFRGASSVESAALGGAAHLVNFLGTDTVPPLVLLRDYYGSQSAAGYSVPASEHSTITSWGREHEVDAFRNMIEQYGNYPVYACVSDSYDIWNAAKNLWGKELKAEILNAKGTLVVRPDSGDPAFVVTKLCELLGEAFGYTTNEKGFKVLNPKVRVVQGDGMDYDSIDETLDWLEVCGWSADNVTFGMGGGLLQKVNRDTQKFAFKCSSVVVDGVERDVYKEPITDVGKNSKRGRLSLIFEHGKYKTIPYVPSFFGGDLLETVYEDGKVVKNYSLAEIRERVHGTT